MLEQNWSNIEATLEDAVSIAFDGCHKIYILMDEQEHKQMRDYGYDPLIRLETIGVESALKTLHKWYDEACGLKFINSVRTVKGDPNKGFTALIEQGESDMCEYCGGEDCEGFCDEIEFCNGCAQEIDLCECDVL